jgi:cold shock CspA family protein
MTRATITNWPRRRTFGFAQTDEGVCVFVHVANLSDHIERDGHFTLRGRRIEFDMIKSPEGSSVDFAAMNVRLIAEEDRSKPIIAPASHAAPVQKEIPRDVAIALGLIDEPKSRKQTKRDRIGV